MSSTAERSLDARINDEYAVQDHATRMLSLLRLTPWVLTAAGFIPWLLLTGTPRLFAPVLGLVSGWTIQHIASRTPRADIERSRDAQALLLGQLMYERYGVRYPASARGEIIALLELGYTVTFGDVPRTAVLLPTEDGSRYRLFTCLDRAEPTP